MTVPRLTSDQRRALRILADAQRTGVTEALMLAHGFRREMLAGLVLAELATVVTRTMRAGGRPIKVDHYVITDDGQDALGES
jgi:hypothetical protein